MSAAIPYLVDVTLATGYGPLAAVDTIFTGNVRAKLGNATPIELQTVGAAVSTLLAATESVHLERVNLNDIQGKGNGLIVQIQGIIENS